MANVLIIDDEEYIRNVLCRRVEKLNHPAWAAESLNQGTQMIEEVDFDLIFLDVNLPDGNGLELLHFIKQQPSKPEVVIITAVGDPEGAELAIKNGAWDYLTKPFNKDDIILRVNRAIEYRKIKQKQMKPPVVFHADKIIGKSPAIKKCLKQAARSSASSSNVVLYGETGTGKELMARAIHDNSDRCDHPFVVVDCASLPESLVESVLFGHVKGAFTGADKATDGLILQADKGTLFLDEIGELPATLQAGFLRVLQERKFRPVGSPTEKQSDFRLISATNRNLDEMVSNGNFRRDLFHRIRTFAIEIPPLRKRKTDIYDLMVHYVKNLCIKHDLSPKIILPETLELLESYHWPGNVRELVNTLERAMLSEPEAPMLYPFFLPDHIRINFVKQGLPESRSIENETNQNTFESILYASIDKDAMPTLKDFRNHFLDKIEKVYLRTVLSQNEWDIEKTARISGLSKNRIYVLTKKYSLQNL